MTSENPKAEKAVIERRKAVDAAIRANDRLLIQWLNRKFNDAETARDIAQTAYLRVWRYAETQNIENPKALLFKTAANLAANEFRARRRAYQVLRAAAGAEGDALNHVASDVPSPERAAVAKQDLAASLSAIRAMPAHIRRAFVLNRFEDKNYREIAKEMNVSQSSVEKYIIAALKILRNSVKVKKKSAQVISLTQKSARSKRVEGDDRN